jgi:gamma-glutamylcysteine synthetase
VLDLAKKGLQQRGFGEEEFLEPLYERIAQQANPAQKMLHQLSNDIDIENVILEYSTL